MPTRVRLAGGTPVSHRRDIENVARVNRQDLMKRYVKNRTRRLHATLVYLRRPFIAFLPLFLSLVSLLIVGSICFHHLYLQEQLSYARALYITYCLIFMEHLIRFPDHWVLQLFYFILPPLGLIVILDGLVRFGYRVLRRNEEDPEWVRAMAKTYRNHVVLCGLGHVGLRVLEQLIQLEEEVVALEKDADNANVAFARRHQVPVLIGNGRDDQTLKDLNVETAKSIILATNDDLANLEMALDARRYNPDIQVVMRMFDQELASKIHHAFNIHLAFSTAALAAPLFATSSSDPSIVNSFYVDGRLLVVARLLISGVSQLAGKQIRELGMEHRVFVLAVVRDSAQTHFPSGEMVIQVGDLITVQTEPDTLKKLHTWNRDAQAR